MTERQTEPGMGHDFEEELTVAARVEKLVPGQPPERMTAQDEPAGVESEFLLATRSLFSDQADGFDLLESTLRDAKPGKDFAHPPGR